MIKRNLVMVVLLPIVLSSADFLAGLMDPVRLFLYLNKLTEVCYIP